MPVFQKTNTVLANSSVKLSFTFTDRLTNTSISGDSSFSVRDAYNNVKYTGQATSEGSGRYSYTIPGSVLPLPGRYQVRASFVASTGETLTQDFDLVVVRNLVQ